MDFEQAMNEALVREVGQLMLSKIALEVQVRGLSVQVATLTATQAAKPVTIVPMAEENQPSEAAVVKGAA